MLPPDTLRRIRRLELQTRRLVQSSMAGAYKAVFKGRGVVFDSVRPYTPGDDVRDIDWNVTARTGEVHVKRMVEERDLTMMLALDSSASVLFGTQSRQKRDVAAELGAVLAWAAIANNDRVGLLVFSDRVERLVVPRRGRTHVLRLIRDLMLAVPTHPRTDLGLALRSLSQTLRRRTIVFVLSDFLAPPESYARDLLTLGHRHDVVAVVLRDPLEVRVPNIGLLRVLDVETGAETWVDTAAPAWRAEYSAQAQARREMLTALFARCGVDSIDLPVNADVVRALTVFFRQRRARAGRP